MRRWVIVTAFIASTLLRCNSAASASVIPSLTTTIVMDCSMFSMVCTFDPRSQGSPEQGWANFSPVAPGWSATFDSGPAIAWGVIGGSYQAEFGRGGSFTVAAPGGMQLSGMLSSGVAFRFPGGFAETVAWFQGDWNNGPYAEGVMAWDNLDAGSPVTLEVTTLTPEPGSFLLFGSAFAGLVEILRRTRH